MYRVVPQTKRGNIYMNVQLVQEIQQTEERGKNRFCFGLEGIRYSGVIYIIYMNK